MQLEHKEQMAQVINTVLFLFLFLLVLCHNIQPENRELVAPQQKEEVIQQNDELEKVCDPLILVIRSFYVVFISRGVWNMVMLNSQKLEVQITKKLHNHCINMPISQSRLLKYTLSHILVSITHTVSVVMCAVKIEKDKAYLRAERKRQNRATNTIQQFVHDQEEQHDRDLAAAEQKEVFYFPFSSSVLKSCHIF